MIALERRLRGQRIDELEPRCRTERHRDGDRAIQLHNWRWGEPGKSFIERHDACPVRLLGGKRPRMTGSNRSLESVRTPEAAELFSAIERRETATDEEVVPVGTILVEQQNGLPRGTHARPGTRRLNLHQRDEAVDFRLLRSKLGEDTAEAERILAEGRAHPVVTCSRRVALVKDEIDNLEHGSQTRGQIGTARNLKGSTCLAECALGTDNALCDRRLRNEKRARDLVRRQSAEQPKRERDLRLGGEHRMARGEHEA